MAKKPTYKELEQRVKKLEKAESERKQAEEASRQYEHIISATDDHMSFLDRNYIYQAVNEAYLRAHQKAREEIIGHTVADLLGADVFERLVKENLDRCLAGEQIHYQSWFDFPGLGQRYMDVVYYSYAGVDGTVLGIVVSSRDITDRKQAEEALKESEEKYHRLYKLMRLMADNMPDLIWAKDMDGRYMFVNQAMCDKLIMCDCPEEAIDLTDMVIAEKERNAGYEPFGEIYANSDAIIQERKVACRILEEGFVRDKYLVLDVHKAPFFNENGEIIGTVGCGRDVTNEKKVEKALKEREIELGRKNLRLEELNSALKILLEKRDGDKKVLEEKVLMNIKKLIIPYVVKLKKTPLNDRQEIFVEIIQSNIEDILSPFAHKLSYKYLNFTPTEVQVADFVKQGFRTKEIADLLNSSPETVSGHRKSMRKKLNLKDKKTNLRTHLLFLNNG
jgi:PAS domain S-box-containing protein